VADATPPTPTQPPELYLFVGGRMNILFRFFPYSIDRETVRALAIEALKDRSRIVRDHACATLAYSLDSSALAPLRELLQHKVSETLTGIGVLRSVFTNFANNRGKIWISYRIVTVRILVNRISEIAERAKGGVSTEMRWGDIG